MKLDLSNMASWDDATVIDTLNDIEFGLSMNQLDWVDILTKAVDEKGSLTPRQRETAEGILKTWNSKRK